MLVAAIILPWQPCHGIAVSPRTPASQSVEVSRHGNSRGTDESSKACCRRKLT